MTWATEQAALLDELLGQFGVSVTFVRTAKSAYDPAAGKPTIATATQTVTARVEPVRTSHDPVGPGVRPRMRAVVIICRAADFSGWRPAATTESEQHAVTIDGRAYSVSAVDEELDGLKLRLRCREASGG